MDNKTEKLRQTLNASGISDLEISQTLKLDQVGYKKLADQMGMSPDEVESLLSQLTAFLKKKNELTEQYSLMEFADVEDDKESFDDEINAKFGTYNFVWIYEDLSGTGTAMYSDKGVSVVSVRDQQGKQILKFKDSGMIASIKQQAVDFIGNV